MRTILLLMALALPIRAEDPIGPPPTELVDKLKLAPFYQKHLDCKGLPILSSNRVSDAAQREAANIVEHMLEGRDDIRKAIVGSGVRLGGVNFLHDKSQKPYMRSTDIDHYLGTSPSSGAAKLAAIRKMFKMHQLDPNWTLPSRLDDNPLVWMLQVNGFMVDVRHVPREV